MFCYEIWPVKRGKYAVSPNCFLSGTIVVLWIPIKRTLDIYLFLFWTLPTTVAPFTLCRLSWHQNKNTNNGDKCDGPLETLLEGAGRCGRSTFKKNIRAREHLMKKRYARQVTLKNIPKIQCTGNNNEKNSYGSKKSLPLQRSYILPQPEMSRKYIFYVWKSKARRCTMRVWFSCLIAVFIYNIFVVLHLLSRI